MSVKKPNKPKFPKKPKSNNPDALERWVKRCEEIRSDYNKKEAEWKKEDTRVKNLIAKGKKAKEIK
ncbi:MAG: hypothetical protein O9264_08755 [Leptospira sp.]|nr:hypothetical protein [Leptospira sp.]